MEKVFEKEIEKIEKIKKEIKEMKVVKREMNGYSRYVVEVTLINGKKFDARLKSYDMDNLVDEVGANNFTITYETRTSSEKQKEFDTFVVSCPEASYETFAFASRENVALMVLLSNKK